MTLGQALGDAFAKLKEDLGTDTKPNHPNSQPPLGLPARSTQQVHVPASWRDGSKTVPTQKRRDGVKRNESSRHGAAKPTVVITEPYPALPSDARERAQRLARKQVDKIASDRAHRVAVEQSKNETSVLGQRRKYNEVLAMTREQVAKNAYPRIYEQRCKNEAERLRKGLLTYVEVRERSLDAPSQKGTICLPEVLRIDQMSADMSKLKILGASAEALPADTPAVKDSHATAFKIAIMGMDFGTAFTKTVIGWEQKRFAVDWSAAVKLDEPYLLPSVFSESADGIAVLGFQAGAGWATRSGLKMQILEVVNPSDDILVDAVIFVALAFRQAANSFLKRHPIAAEGELRWRLHLGLPAKAWDDTAIAHTFRTLAAAAMCVALSNATITRSLALDALANQSSEFAGRVSVMPEFACQLYSYLGSTQRQPDLHALIDVGAGTLDVAFFNVHDADDSDVLPIFSAAVAQLGAHHLIGACAGKAGESLEWMDRDSSKSIGEFAAVTRETEPVVSARRQTYLNQLASVIRDAYNEARGRYPDSKIFRGNAPLELFLCGGGKGVDVIATRIRKVATDSAAVYGVKIVVLPLPQPDDLEDYHNGAFDRMSVAYGLSQLERNVGDVRRRSMVDPYEKSFSNGIEDRDATR